ncbi:MAG TPA: molecular chaperone DnaJ, partial [Myxococcales bacterium]
MPSAPSPDDRSSSALASGGDIAKVSPFHPYFIAASTDETGLLTFVLPDRKIEIHFRKGNPELIDSSHPEDSIAQFALDQNWINQEQLARAQSSVNDYDGDLLSTLFGLKMLDRAAAFE